MAKKKIGVSGYKKELPNGREVFVGHHTNDGEYYYIRFQNSEGNHTKLKVSPEAFEALIGLKDKLDRGGQPYWVFKNENGEWQKA